MKEDHDHPHRYHSRHEKHEHTHGVVDPSLFATERGIWAVKWSFAGLFMTALFQAVIVLYSGSIALLADTVQNFRKRSRKKRSATRGNRREGREGPRGEPGESGKEKFVERNC